MCPLDHTSSPPRHSTNHTTTAAAAANTITTLAVFIAEPLIQFAARRRTHCSLTRKRAESACALTIVFAAWRVGE